MADSGHDFEHSWQQALEDELGSMHKLSQEISDAEVCRTPSTYAGGDSPPAARRVARDSNKPSSSNDGDWTAPVPPTWWAHVLSQAAQDQGRVALPLPSKGLQVVSGCSGCCAEGFVMKARPRACVECLASLCSIPVADAIGLGDIFWQTCRQRPSKTHNTTPNIDLSPKCFSLLHKNLWPSTWSSVLTRPDQTMPR